MTTALQTTFFDYGELDAETRIVVQQEDKEYDRNMGEAGANFLRACHNLMRIQKALRYKRPGFVDYCRSKPGLSQPTAWRMISVAKLFTVNNINASPNALYLLAAQSTPEGARIEAIARGENGEEITPELARGIIHDHKAPALPFVPDEEYDDEDDEFQSPLSPYEQENAARYLERQAEDMGLQVTITPVAPRYEPISDRPDYDGDEWKTPSEWIDAARMLLGEIDLDPASNDLAQEIVHAAKYYTKDQNGLTRAWIVDGQPSRVWCNPPYSTALVQAFTMKAIEEYEYGNVDQALILVNNCTDTAWFFNIAQRFPVMFSRGRVGFWYENPDDKTPTRQGQAVFYLGPNIDRFYECFAHLAYAPIGRSTRHADNS